MSLTVVASAPRDDQTLVAACLRGERAAERELFRREYPRVNRTLYRLLGPGRDSEDLVQETFVEAFRSLRTWRGEARLGAWIDRIAVRVGYRWIAERRPGVQLELIEDRAGGPRPEGQLEAREGLRRLYVALGQLGVDARVAFALHMIDGRSVADVARLVGTSTVTTKVRIWRARREIARMAAADPVLAAYVTRRRGEDGP